MSTVGHLRRFIALMAAVRQCTPDFLTCLTDFTSVANDDLLVAFRSATIEFIAIWNGTWLDNWSISLGVVKVKTRFSEMQGFLKIEWSLHNLWRHYFFGLLELFNNSSCVSTFLGILQFRIFVLNVAKNVLGLTDFDGSSLLYNRVVEQLLTCVCCNRWVTDILFTILLCILLNLLLLPLAHILDLIPVAESRLLRGIIYSERTHFIGGALRVLIGGHISQRTTSGRRHCTSPR